MSFRNTSNDPVYVDSTDRVSSSIASDAHFTVPAVTVSGDPATNIISGTCLADRPFQINANDPAYARPHPATSAHGTTDGAGQSSVNATTNEPAFDLSAGDNLEVVCSFATGDVVGRSGSIAP